MARIIYKPFGAIFGALGGVAAGMLFRQLWKAIAHEEQAPTATEAGRSWAEVLGAAAAQGAVFAVVKTVVDRVGATVFEKATGIWPGESPGAAPA